MTDELTGAPNRRAVLGRLKRLLRRNDCGPCSILILDIDHFKDNQRSSRARGGDDVLKVVADEVRGSLMEPRFSGGLGGGNS